MRMLSMVLAVAVGAVSVTAPARGADDDVLSAIAGHWRCSVAGAPGADRFYYRFPAGTSGRGEAVYGREETSERDHTPVVAFERISATQGGGAHIEAVEGSGEATALGPHEARFVDFVTRSESTFSLTYVVDANGLQRTASQAGKVVDDERCTRVPEPPFPSTCAHPNVPPATLEAAEPGYPAAAVAARAHGIVDVRVTLDEHSRVMWTEVVKSDNHLLDDEAILSARLSRFRTETRDCRPIAASYIFSVAFSIR